jgi:hypothetical protein
MKTLPKALFPPQLPMRRRGAPGSLMREGAVGRPSEGSMLFLGQFAAYVLLMGMAYSAQSGLLKTLGNVYAVVIFGLVAFAWATRRHPPSRWATAAGLAYVIYLTGIVCSIVVTPEVDGWADLVKIVICPAFLIFGAAFERARAERGQPFLWQQPAARWMLAVLIVVPLVTWGGQLLQSGFEIDGVRETSIFANRNNASVYAVTVLAMVTVILGRPLKSLLLYMAVGVMFGTLGVLLAVVLALALTVARPRELLALALLLGLAIAGYLAFPEWGPFKRFTPVIESLRLIAEGRIKLYATTFGELVLLLKTQDLSFVFRLKHWTDLMATWLQGDIYHWLFGYGVGSSVRMSDLRLVPHNDYLRVLFEFGLVTLTGFMALLALVFARLRRRWETVPLLAVVLYLFSENLTTNYTAMAFFFFAAGALAERAGLQRVPRPAG